MSRGFDPLQSDVCKSSTRLISWSSGLIFWSHINEEVPHHFQSFQITQSGPDLAKTSEWLQWTGAKAHQNVETVAPNQTKNIETTAPDWTKHIETAANYEIKTSRLSHQIKLKPSKQSHQIKQKHRNNRKLWDQNVETVAPNQTKNIETTAPDWTKHIKTAANYEIKTSRLSHRIKPKTSKQSHQIGSKSSKQPQIIRSKLRNSRKNQYEWAGLKHFGPNMQKPKTHNRNMKTIEKCNGFCRDLKAQQKPMKQNYVRNPGFKELLAGFELKPGFKQKPISRESSPQKWLQS